MISKCVFEIDIHPLKTVGYIHIYFKIYVNPITYIYICLKIYVRLSLAKSLIYSISGLIFPWIQSTKTLSVPRLAPRWIVPWMWAMLKPSHHIIFLVEWMSPEAFAPELLPKEPSPPRVPDLALPESRNERMKAPVKFWEPHISKLSKLKADPTGSLKGYLCLRGIIRIYISSIHFTPLPNKHIIVIDASLRERMWSSEYSGTARMGITWSWMPHFIDVNQKYLILQSFWKFIRMFLPDNLGPSCVLQQLWIDREQLLLTAWVALAKAPWMLGKF